MTQIRNDSLPRIPNGSGTENVGTSDLQNAENVRAKSVIQDGALTDDEYAVKAQSAGISLEKKGDMILQAALRRQLIESGNKE